MISHIKGAVCCAGDGAVVVEARGVGFSVYANDRTVAAVKPGDEIQIFTHMLVREDGISLYGFLTKEELGTFNLLITVTGVGPKVALGVLNVMKPKDIDLAILTEDAGAFLKAPGVGKKTAQMIIFKLKDQISKETVINVLDPQFSLNGASVAKQDSMDALVTLGYSKSEALKAVLETALPEMKTEQIIKLALKKLNK